MDKDAMLKLADEILEGVFDTQLIMQTDIESDTLKAIVREWRQFTQFEGKKWPCECGMCSGERPCPYWDNKKKTTPQSLEPEPPQEQYDSFFDRR